ncbi:MAG TPA: hypothetical protein VIL29_08775 [Pseudothermotoga sp.]
MKMYSIPLDQPVFKQFPFEGWGFYIQSIPVDCDAYVQVDEYETRSLSLGRTIVFSQKFYSFTIVVNSTHTGKSLIIWLLESIDEINSLPKESHILTVQISDPPIATEDTLQLIKDDSETIISKLQALIDSVSTETTLSTVSSTLTQINTDLNQLRSDVAKETTQTTISNTLSQIDTDLNQLRTDVAKETTQTTISDTLTQINSVLSLLRTDVAKETTLSTVSTTLGQIDGSINLLRSDVAKEITLSTISDTLNIIQSNISTILNEISTPTSYEVFTFTGTAGSQTEQQYTFTSQSKEIQVKVSSGDVLIKFGSGNYFIPIDGIYHIKASSITVKENNGSVDASVTIVSLEA